MKAYGHVSRPWQLSRVGSSGNATALVPGLLAGGGALVALGAVDPSAWIALGLIPVAMAAAAAGSDDEAAEASEASDAAAGAETASGDEAGGADGGGDGGGEAAAAEAPAKKKRKKRKKKRAPKEKRPMSGAVSGLLQLVGFAAMLGCIVLAAYKDRADTASLLSWVITATIGISGLALVGYARERAGKPRAYAVPGGVKWVVMIVGVLLAAGTLIRGFDALLNDPAVEAFDPEAWSLTFGTALALIGLLQMRKNAG